MSNPTFSEANNHNGFQQGRNVVQLSDGTLVFFSNTANDSYTIYYTTDRVTINTVGTFTPGTAVYASASICVDASDNIYMVGPGTANLQFIVQAFKKGSGYSWTAQTSHSFTYNASSSNTNGNMLMQWINVGGTNSAGQIVVVRSYNPSGATGYIPQMLLCDAGALLAGTTPSYVCQPMNDFGACGQQFDMVTDGIGGPGLWFAANPAGNVHFYPAAAYYKFTTNNTIPANSYYVGLTSNWGSLVGHLTPYGAGLCAWVSQSTTNGFVAGLGTTGLSFAFTQYTSPVSFSGINMDAAYCAVTGVVEVVGWQTTSGGVVNYSISPSATPAPSAATTIQPASLIGTDSEQAVCATNVMRKGYLDYQVICTNNVYGSYIQYTSAPNAPTLSSPGNAAYIDVASGVTLVGTFNSTDAQNQNAYACRIKVSGAGSYSYYNASTNALQSTIVWNAVSTAPGASWSVSIPSSAVSDGNVCNWSLASQEAGANLQGPFASDFTFNAQSAPGLTVNGPSGSETTTTSPAVTWTTTPPSGASQTAYRVVVEHGAYGTTPGSGTQDWDSTLTSSSAQSATVGATLSNGTTYRAFVQVTETGGQTSGWGYTTFTVTLDAPATPGITATPGTDPTTGAPRVTLQINGHDNLLSAADAGFDGSVGTWTAAANTAISDSSAEALDGPSSMAVTAVASGTAQATTATYSL